MRRQPFITAFAFFLAIPLWAQHAGLAGFGGSHSGSFSGHTSSGSRPGPSHFSGGVRGSNFNRGSFRSARNFSQPFFHSQFRGRFHARSFRNTCFGFACRGFGYPYGGYYDPWIWSWADDDARFDRDYDNNIARANEMNEQSLEQQRMWRQEEADGDQDIYAPRQPLAQQDSELSPQQGTPITPPTVLVFRDRHQQEIQNYAIVGQTLWNFSTQRTQKIPLADLDIAATQKANDDRGVTFQLPALGQGQ